MIPIFIPSYHRPNNNLTAQYFKKIGYDMELVTVFVDNETDDIEDYRASCEKFGCNLEVFDMAEARRRYDYVHRPSEARRSAGQARNMFQDYAKQKGYDFYCVIDDDTEHYQLKGFGRNPYRGMAKPEDVFFMMEETEKLMRSRKIGVFAWAQTGDFIGGESKHIFRRKVMNTTFYLLPYIYRGERGVQDEDTAMFAGMMNEGLFTGSYGCGCVLLQKQSATQKGGLTDLYNECKLLNKALVCPIQFPSAIYGEKQKMNGGRLHHHINNKYLMPRVLKGDGSFDNIAWDTYPEDIPFTNEPKRKWSYE